MLQTRIILIATFAFFFCGLAAFAGGLGLGFGLSDALAPTPTLEFSSPPPTAESTYEPVEQPAPPENLLLEEDFSGEGWNVAQDKNHRQGYEDGRYFIAVDTTDFSYWSVAKATFSDFVVAVETSQVDGPHNNNYGVMLRYQDDDNFYSFEISGDGYYTFTKAVDGQYFSIIPWRESGAINLDHTPNLLRVEAAGSNFNLYINDELVDAAIDSEFKQGDVGLLAGTYEESGVHIAFDNLKVWQVKDK